MRHGGVWAPILVGLGVMLVLASSPARAQLPFGEKEYEYELSDVLPDAQSFERTETDGGYWRGYADEAQQELVGFVLLTDDLVDIPGYSGETLNTLVGMDTKGKITGVKIVHHSEPIVLIGLDESTIHEFTDQYPGKNITDRILISNEAKEGYTVVDGISGATVTAVAENATVLEASRLVARAEGIISAADVRTRRPSTDFRELSWPELVSRGAIGSITAEAGEQDLPSQARGVDIRFAVLDPPSVGRNLLGERFYDIVTERLERDGGSALYIGSLSGISFKGAGFARGGIFDRFVVEQSGDLFVFKDLDYMSYPVLPIDGAPNLQEGGIFFVDAAFDPTKTFSFRLTLPYRVNDQRSYATFLADYTLPDRFVESDQPFWVSRWQASWGAVLFTGLLLAVITVSFVLKDRMTPYRKVLHVSTAILAAVGLGLVLKAQPSTTQILTFFGSLSRLEFPEEIYLSEPLIFMLWIAIAVTLVIWGRGFFCGWVCPYGALLESLIALWHKVAPKGFRKKMDAWRPPWFLRYGKMATFVVILLVSFASLPLAEALDEVEPFKTFVLHLARPAGFVIYFAAITLVSVVSYRFFCRFMCPLGGALAIPSTKKPLLPLFRYESCAWCKICAKGCEPQAISFETGVINYQECLQCWDCQATGKNEAVCPELIVADKENRAPRYVVGGILVMLLLGWPAAPEAKEIRVSPGGLQTALDEAGQGDVLLLEPGVHEGAVVITKSVTLRGSPDADVIVDGRGTGHVLVVDAPGVAVEDLELRNCRIDDDFADSGIWVEKASTGARILRNTVENCRFGIWIHGTESAEVIDNRVSGLEELTQNQRGDCIHLWDADGVTVSGNTVTHCRDGIYMELTSSGRIAGNEIFDSRYAVHTMWCDHSRYIDNYATENLVGLALMFSQRIESARNVLHNNRTHGMLWVQVTRGQAYDNVIIGNTKGIFVYNSLYNEIRGNLIARNNLGAHYWGGSEDNVMEKNAFIDNEIQAKFVAAKDQEWNGNFWSDYNGWDVNEDGKGDAPYRSNTLVDSLLWEYPHAKFLLASPAFQLLALAEREFPVITVPKAVDASPLMTPPMAEWKSLLTRYPGKPPQYYLEMQKLPHLPGEDR